MNRIVKISMQNRCLLGLQNFQCVVPKRNLQQRRDAKVENPNEPIEFFGSGIDKVRVTPTPSIRPKYSPYIINFSLATFLIYFLILREENDVDELLSRDLYDHFGEEASRLKKAYDYNIKHNLPTEEILDRLREVGAPVPPKK